MIGIESYNAIKYELREGCNLTYHQADSFVAPSRGKLKFKRVAK